MTAARLLVVADRANGTVAAGFAVHVSDRGDAPVGEVSRWGEVVRSTLVHEQAPPGSVDLMFVDADTIAQLNRQHLGGDGPTDVLSFPIDGAETDSAVIDRHIGDIVICPSVAAAAAADHVGDLEGELTLLIVHGVLHLLGHDHGEPAEAAIMADIEQRHLQRYGLAHPGPQR